jgi:signal transduction histidine kinase
MGMSWAIYGVLALKLFTNTLAGIALRRRRWELELGGINVAMDLVVMTTAIQMTGGVLSPLLSLYVVEIAVIALLTNLGTTLLMAGAAFVLYSATAIGTQLGWLPRTEPPITTTAGITTGYLAFGLAYAALVLATPTFYTSFILRALNAKEQALRRRTEELVEASRQKGHFMANVTHELRTPLHGILGLTELVQTGIYGDLSERQQEALTDVRRSAKGLLTLIDDLLELASDEAGRTSLSLSPVDLREVVEAALGSVRFLRHDAQLELGAEVEPGLPPIVSDRRKLAQILVNLLANAVKFTPEGGRVAVRVSRDGERLVIAVEDSGIGIPAGELSRIFDDFRQVDGTSAREYGGVGLGLALVKRLVCLLSGDIEVVSREGHGSTFTVRLPLAA